MVVVVEGKNDANKIKSIFMDAQCIITNGSAIDASTLELIKKSSLKDNVVLCLDPDGPGEKIRRLIMERVPNVSHVFANKAKAISRNKKKIGIEHMLKSDIIEMFSGIRNTKVQNHITYEQLYKLGFMDSKIKRNKACEKLGFSYCNGKQFLKRINMFNISIEELKEV